MVVIFFFFTVIFAIEKIVLNSVQGRIGNKRLTDKCKFVGQIYYSEVFFGTPLQKIRIVWDTTQTKTWILSSECKAGLCLDNKTRYNGNASDSFVQGEFQTILKEGNNMIKGIVSKDLLFVGKLDGFEKPFIEVTKAFGPQLEEWRFDGVFGLEKKGSQPWKIQFLGNSIEKKLVERNVFGIWLKKDLNTEHAGEITLGGFDSTKIIDKVKFIPLRKHGRWEMTLFSIFINGKVVIEKPRIAAISTASFLITIPEDDAILIHDPLIFKKEGDLYNVSCDMIEKLKEITFALGNHRFTLTPKEYIFIQDNKCFSGFVGVKETTSIEKTWSFGSLFLQTYYGIFDLNSGRVGLARSI